MGTIMLISCVSQKVPHRSPARALYTSTLFKLNLAYAESLKPDAIFILLRQVWIGTVGCTQRRLWPILICELRLSLYKVGK